MKKAITILGLVSILTLASGGVQSYTALAEEKAYAPAPASEQVWDATETFDNLTSVKDNFDFHFVSTQNARREDEFEYSWELRDGAVSRTGNIDSQADTVNIAIMTYVGDVYDDFEMSVDFKAGTLTPYWPVVGIRQQIPGKNYTTAGGGAGVFMQQNGKITLWGPIVSGNVQGNLYEVDIPNKSSYYALMWHTMRIRAEGTMVTIFVDDVQVAKVMVNATDYAKGYLSLMSVNNDCSFDNFKVRGLASSASSGNEVNRNEYADFGQSLDDIIKNGYTGAKLPTGQPSTTVGAPTVTPANQQVSTEDAKNDVTYSIGYNNGAFESLKLNGLTVADEHYTRVGAQLILHGDYVETLPAGENTFTLTTSGGSVEFTLTIERDTVVFTDKNRIKKFSTVDISFKMDFGVGALDKVTLGGAILPETAYTYQEGALRIKRAFLSGLPTGVYEVRVFDAKGTFVDCAITVGMDTADVYMLNFDSFTAPETGYGQDLTISTGAGMYGAGSHVASNGSGTLMVFDKDNINYAFKHGTSYTVTTYFKFDRTVEGTSSVLDLLIPIYFKTSSGNADIGYLRYSDANGYYFYPESNCAGYSFTKEGEWYRLAFSFTYNSSWTRLEFPVWMVTEFTMDNFVLAPGMLTTATVSLPESIALPKNPNADLTLDCAVGVIGINYNDTALTADDFIVSGGKLTLKQSFLSTLSSGVNTLTVCCVNSYHTLVLELNAYDLSVSGNTAYTLGDGDMTLTVARDGFDLNDATITCGDKTLVKGTDYAVSGDSLILKEAFLQTVVGSAEVTITFTADAVLSFEVTSNRLLNVDFDGNGINKGFAFNMTQELVAGAEGNGMRLTNTTSATMLTLGGAFYDITFEEGKTYTFSFDLKISEINTSNNFVIAGNSCWMPITFGSAKDVTYLRVTKNGNAYAISNETQQVGIAASVGQPDANGFVHIEFTFTVKAGCTTLTFDVWMPSDITIDNLCLVRA